MRERVRSELSVTPTLWVEGAASAMEAGRVGQEGGRKGGVGKGRGEKGEVGVEVGGGDALTAEERKGEKLGFFGLRGRIHIRLLLRMAC